MDNYQQLWSRVQEVPFNPAMEPSELQMELQAYRDKLIHLLQNKVRTVHSYFPNLDHGHRVPAVLLSCNTIRQGLAGAIRHVSSLH